MAKFRFPEALKDRLMGLAKTAGQKIPSRKTGSTIKTRFSGFRGFRLDNVKMRQKLLLMVLITGLIPVVAVSLINLNRAEGELTHEVEKGNLLFAEVVRNQLNEYFYGREVDGQVLAASRIVAEGVEEFNRLDLAPIEARLIETRFSRFLGLVQQKYQYTDIYITDRYGNILYSVNYNPSDISGLSVTGTHFRTGIQGTQNWSEIFHHTFINDNIMVLATPVYGFANPDAVVGTLNIVLNQEKINSIVHTGVERLGQTADAYLVNADGLMLSESRIGANAQDAALKVTLETEATAALSQALQAGDTTFEDTLRYTGPGGHPVLAALSVAELGSMYGGFIIEVEEGEVFAGLAAMRWATLIAALVVLLAGIVIAWFMSNSFVRPIAEVIGQTQRIAAYDLSVKTENGKRKDEIGSLQDAVHLIGENLREIIREVSQSAESVAASSEELTATSQQSALASEEVARTITEISQGTGEQAESTSEASRQLTLLTEVIEEDQDYLTRLVEATRTVEQLTTDGLEAIRVLSEKTDESGRAAGEIGSSIQKTNDSSARIGEASSLISSIAEQTNLLALNAAIEAARAGEHGRGFAVVADEIRKLAEQSRNSTRIIDEMVKTLQSDAHHAVSTMKQVEAIVGEQVDSVNLTGEKYREIAGAIGQAVEMMTTLQESGSRMRGMKEEVADRIARLSAVAEENAAATQEASASMEQQTASMGEIANSSEGLSSLAQNLQTLISRFRV